MTTVALMGNPNTGKTTIFNQITDSYAYVGNWTGVTVEKKMGTIKHSDVMVTDLPGVYSLNPLTKDESVAINYLLTDDADLILNVTNAGQLKRNLLLSIELLEYGTPVIIALNMIDDLKRSGIYYDIDTLSDRLGCHIETTNARNKDGIKQLREELLNIPHDKIPQGPLELDYPFMIKQAIRQASEKLIADFDMKESFARWIAIQYIDKNKSIRKYALHNNLTPLLSQKDYYDAQNFEDKIFKTRLNFIDSTLAEAKNNLSDTKNIEMTSRIDKFVTNPILGLPIFIAIFYLMFKISFDWIGTPLSNQLDALLSGPISSFANQFLTSIGAMDFLRSLIVDGVIAGVGGVLTFIPQIFALFACISLLEDSGYMARAALVTDRIMEMIGLNGKAFIPLIIGFGCNVTGIMAARTIEQPKERLITTLISPFMSCSARLPIYSLFVAAFFPRNQALVVLSIYFLGIAVALGMAKFYQLVFHVKDSTVFIVELPKYHIPRLDIIWRGTWDKSKGFVKKAGTVIFAGTVLIWLLSNFGPTGFITNIDHSFSALLGKVMLPVFAPIGITSWEAISALFTGILAKEVISSSMMVLFHTTSQTALIATFGQMFTPVSAYALLVFILLYVPCFATIGTIKSETGSTKWAIYSIFSSLFIAYTLSFIIFQIGSLLF
ncbi:ferrous iron transport protein B [Companilactobacillus allii]|uniref:Ferrous iron transport protein B n=1 Tax=Companilactobacillus allii TaxID=1847728 RepID=A0A1P8Q485_9LACO|nr:ferrous iron transport protein B [Companilactobacillus allii]APX72657.1 ferrous iron transport protein B [Companilactobacillus allii]USQ69760.1 ferrous iron transport protein B [Companilactobacillus allii]